MLGSGKRRQGAETLSGSNYDLQMKRNHRKAIDAFSHSRGAFGRYSANIAGESNPKKNCELTFLRPFSSIKIFVFILLTITLAYFDLNRVMEKGKRKYIGSGDHLSLLNTGLKLRIRFLLVFYVCV